MTSSPGLVLALELPSLVEEEGEGLQRLSARLRSALAAALDLQLPSLQV